VVALLPRLPEEHRCGGFAARRLWRAATRMALLAVVAIAGYAQGNHWRLRWRCSAIASVSGNSVEVAGERLKHVGVRQRECRLRRGERVEQQRVMPIRQPIECVDRRLARSAVQADECAVTASR
jgi:hypothetical protein